MPRLFGLPVALLGLLMFIAVLGLLSRSALQASVAADRHAGFVRPHSGGNYLFSLPDVSSNSLSSTRSASGAC